MSDALAIKPQKPTKRSLEKALAERLTRLVPKLELEPQKPPKHTVFFARMPPKDGLTHGMLIRSWARDEVRLCVVIEHDLLGEAIAKALGATKPVTKESPTLPVEAFVGAALARAMGRPLASIVALYKKRLAKSVDAPWRRRQLDRLKMVVMACGPL